MLPIPPDMYGTTFSATNANTYAREQCNDTSVVNKKAIFDRIVDASDIVSVMAGNAGIPVSTS